MSQYIVIGACGGLILLAVIAMLYMLILYMVVQRRYQRGLQQSRQQQTAADVLQPTALHNSHHNYNHHHHDGQEEPTLQENNEALNPTTPEPPPVAPRADPLKQSKWLDLDGIRAVIENLVALEEEFRSIPINDVPVDQIPNEVLDKNRYINILPNPHSRVCLSRENNDPNTEFINANWMDGFTREKEYILTQGPLGNTIIDFWRMVWETGARNIVMIARLMEDGRPKCVKYWADRDEKFKIGKFLLAWNETEVQPFFKITTMRLGNMESREIRTIKHFWYDSWPDHGVPETTESVVDLIMSTMTARNEADAEGGPGTKFPLVVHCSAGVGRSGVFAAADIAVQQAEAYRKIDTIGLLCHLRRARGGCVQTATQWLFFLLIARGYLSMLEQYDREAGVNLPSRTSQSSKVPRKKSADI